MHDRELVTKHLYITGDAIGTPTGGGKVTLHESQALRSLGGDDDTEIWAFPNNQRPWGPDDAASAHLENRPDLRPQIAHFYSGTFSKTIAILKKRGTYISYTAAAHDIEISKREHERLGIPFDYPHLTDKDEWAGYVRGYRHADLVICPSALSEQIMRGYGCENVKVIPHGYDPVDRIAPPPKHFVVGYLGQPGPDKGLIYLLHAWVRWSALTRDQNASLVIAGRGTLGLLPLVRSAMHVGSVQVRGEVDEPRDLYDACTIYVQPSSNEGFGCEVLEARAHGRPVICSRGAGAYTFANEVVSACDPAAIARAIEDWRQRWGEGEGTWDFQNRATIGLESLTWERIRARYTDVWRSL